MGLTAACAASSPARPSATAEIQPAEGRPGSDAPAWHFLRARYDADGDGRIQSAEYTRSMDAFHRLDADGDGLVSAADFDSKWDDVPRIEAEPGKEQDG